MNNAIIFAIGIVAMVGVYFVSKKHGVQVIASAPPAVPPVIPIAGNPSKAKAVVSAGGCAVGAAATAAFISPPAAPLGCAVGAYVAGKVYDTGKSAVSSVGSAAASAWHAVTPW